MIIALDGPSASGKGTIGKLLADKLNCAYLDTGRLFRAVAAQALQQNIALDDVQKLVQIASDLSAEDLASDSLMSEKVGQTASVISQLADVREAITTYERKFGQNIPQGKEGVILDGRDIGTVIFPDADFKVYVTADVETRALRRHNQLLGMSQKSIYDEVLSEMRVRDTRDQNRTVAPLLPADDALIVDTTALSIEKALEKILSAHAKTCSV